MGLLYNNRGTPITLVFEALWISQNICIICPLCVNMCKTHVYKVKSPELKKIAVLSLKYSQIVERWSIIFRTPFEFSYLWNMDRSVFGKLVHIPHIFCKMGHFPKYGPPILKPFINNNICFLKLTKAHWSQCKALKPL